jgi:hypothetical protein
VHASAASKKAQTEVKQTQLFVHVQPSDSRYAGLGALSVAESEWVGEARVRQGALLSVFIYIVIVCLALCKELFHIKDSQKLHRQDDYIVI